MTWHECSQHVLGYKNAIYKKYSNYEHAVRDSNASLVAPTAPPIDLYDGSQLLPPPVDGKYGSWQNVAIVCLLVLVCGLWFRLPVCTPEMKDELVRCFPIFCDAFLLPLSAGWPTSPSILICFNLGYL